MAPMKSKQQWRWMFAAEHRGELPEGTASRWAHHTQPPFRKLPKHVKHSLAIEGLPPPDAVDRLAQFAALTKESNWRGALANALLLFGNYATPVDDPPEVEPSKPTPMVQKINTPLTPPRPLPEPGPAPRSAPGLALLPPAARGPRVVRAPRGLRKLSTELPLHLAQHAPLHAVHAAPNAAAGIKPPAARPLVSPEVPLPHPHAYTQQQPTTSAPPGTAPAALPAPVPASSTPTLPPVKTAGSVAARLAYLTVSKRADAPPPAPPPGAPPPGAPPQPPPGSFKPSPLLATITDPGTPTAQWLQGTHGRLVPQAPGPSQSQSVASGQQLQNNVTLQKRAVSLAEAVNTSAGSRAVAALAAKVARVAVGQVEKLAQGVPFMAPGGMGGNGPGMGAVPFMGQGGPGGPFGAGMGAGGLQGGGMAVRHDPHEQALLQLERQIAYLNTVGKQNPRYAQAIQRQLQGLRQQVEQIQADKDTLDMAAQRRQAAVDKQREALQQKHQNPWEGLGETVRQIGQSAEDAGHAATGMATQLADQQKYETQQQQAEEQAWKAQQAWHQQATQGEQSVNDFQEQAGKDAYGEHMGSLNDLSLGELDMNNPQHKRIYDSVVANDAERYAQQRMKTIEGSFLANGMDDTMKQHMLAHYRAEGKAQVEAYVKEYGKDPKATGSVGDHLRNMEKYNPESYRVVMGTQAAAYQDPRLKGLQGSQAYQRALKDAQKDPNAYAEWYYAKDRAQKNPNDPQAQAKLREWEATNPAFKQLSTLTSNYQAAHANQPMTQQQLMQDRRFQDMYNGNLGKEEQQKAQQMLQHVQWKEQNGVNWQQYQQQYTQVAQQRGGPPQAPQAPPAQAPSGYSGQLGQLTPQTQPAGNNYSGRLSSSAPTGYGSGYGGASTSPFPQGTNPFPQNQPAPAPQAAAQPAAQPAAQLNRRLSQAAQPAAPAPAPAPAQAAAGGPAGGQAPAPNAGAGATLPGAPPKK
jgi:hypothetical protein